MDYFKYEGDRFAANEKWKNSQFDLTDIVLCLTDRHIVWGQKIYCLFSKPQVQLLLNYYVCDFKLIKNELGLTSDYVERGGNIYSKDFNPKRNLFFVTPRNLELSAMKVYNKILQDLEEICKKQKSH